MTPQDFITKWGSGGPAFNLNEEQGAQSHFIDLCDVLGVPRPGSEDGYVFEKQTLVLGEARGYADVFRRGAFAWENKAPGKNLDSALKQLLNYSSALSNPPILVVCDRLQIRVQTQFTGHPTERFTVMLAELAQPDKLALLRRIWLDPESFRPKITSRDITEVAAKSFATLAGQMRKAGHDPQKVSHFLTQCLFCFFAEDVGLLPDRMFDALLNNRKRTPEALTDGISSLFQVMQRGGAYGNDDIPWFNGGLFKTIDVPKLDIMNVTELRNAAALNWSAIDVSIFGTLFERGLDPAKRSQLGAHYTDPATIQRIIEPVLQRPLLQIWELIAPELIGLLAKSKRKYDANYKLAYAKFTNWLDQLKNYRVLDPACGSGNFLFLGLKSLKDIEHQSHLAAEAMGLDREVDLVTGPHNMLGIELNEYAAELARVTVWIGEIQWRLSKGYEFKLNPVLEPLDNIECRDALLTFEGDSKPVEATWPQASIVIGNPPFLGAKKHFSELTESYTLALREVFAGRVPGLADLVTYWFEKARSQIEKNSLAYAGLVATNSIRDGQSRAVLKRVEKTGTLIDVWPDEYWVNEGAAVRVSLISFSAKQKNPTPHFRGQPVEQIFSDLSASSTATPLVDVTKAQSLAVNKNAAFTGTSKKGLFELPGSIARSWTQLPSLANKPIASVLKQFSNGMDITRRSRDFWIIDFGPDMPLADAALFEEPFHHVQTYVKPARDKVRNPAEKRDWWLHARSLRSLRTRSTGLDRVIFTPLTAKYRSFVFRPVSTLADNSVVVITRADDATFGILHSRFHEFWSLKMCKWMGKGNDPRYTPTTCFETFPFPTGLTPKDTASQKTETLPDGSVIPANLATEANQAMVGLVSGATSKRSKTVERPVPTPPAPGLVNVAKAIASAAKHLNDLRENWLNPPDWTDRIPEVTPLGMTTSPYPDRIVAKPGFEKDLAERTLTKLYNARPAWLDAAHKTLDAAVAQAYGWADYTADMPDEEILKRLLALNLERADDDK
jgi:hypothetical protein